MFDNVLLIFLSMFDIVHFTLQSVPLKEPNSLYVHLILLSWYDRLNILNISTNQLQICTLHGCQWEVNATMFSNNETKWLTFHLVLLGDPKIE